MSIRLKALALACVIATGLVSAPVVSAEAQEPAKRKPLRVPVYKKHYYRGGYSVRITDTYNTRRFVDPSIVYQSRGGPFDWAFFFETPRGPYGGTTPYMQ